MGGVSRAAPLEEITVYDNYMDQLSGVYEFSQKTAEYKKIQYPRSNSLFLLAKSAFLPEGYPKSALASSIIGTLAGQAVLIGVGVGDGSASILAASLTWLFKDGAGMVGRILFASWQGIFADVLNDLAFFLEIFSLHTVSLFTALVCVASVMRALVGMVGGATRAAITQHQALEGNMADVAAKDGSQETMSNLLALVINLFLIAVVTGNLVNCKPLPLLGVYAEERYILYCPEWKNSGYKSAHLTFYICIQTDASNVDVIKAMLHAEIICDLCRIAKISGDFKSFWSGDDGVAFFAWTLSRVTRWMPRFLESFDESAALRPREPNWDLSVLQFDPEPWRIYRNMYYN